MSKIVCKLKVSSIKRWRRAERRSRDAVTRIIKGKKKKFTIR